MMEEMANNEGCEEKNSSSLCPKQFFVFFCVNILYVSCPGLYRAALIALRRGGTSVSH